MATMTHGAPLHGVTALVDQEPFQDLVQESHSLIQKILQSIPAVYNSTVHVKLQSPENMVIMASSIGIPSAPVPQVVSEDFSLESALTNMTEGLKLHRELLNAVLPQLDNNSNMVELSNDIGDLDLIIHKMLTLMEKATPSTPSSIPVALRLNDEFDVQAAAHLTLAQLEAFGQNVVLSLKSMERAKEEPQS